VTKDNVSEEIQGPPLAPPVAHEDSELEDGAESYGEPEAPIERKGHHEAVVVEGVQQGYRWVEDE
jgi:hypothetical protein